MNKHPHLDQVCARLHDLQQAQLRPKNEQALTTLKKAWTRTAIVAMHALDVTDETHLLRIHPYLNQVPILNRRIDCNVHLAQNIHRHLLTLVQHVGGPNAVPAATPDSTSPQTNLAPAILNTLHTVHTYLDHLTTISHCLSTKLAYYQNVTRVACAKLDTIVLPDTHTKTLAAEVATALLSKKSALQHRLDATADTLNAFHLGPAFSDLVDQLLRTRSDLKAVQYDIDQLTSH